MTPSGSNRHAVSEFHETATVSPLKGQDGQGQLTIWANPSGRGQLLVWDYDSRAITGNNDRPQYQLSNVKKWRYNSPSNAGIVPLFLSPRKHALNHLNDSLNDATIPSVTNFVGFEAAQLTQVSARFTQEPWCRPPRPSTSPWGPLERGATFQPRSSSCSYEKKTW